MPANFFLVWWTYVSLAPAVGTLSLHPVPSLH
jgi:hypothetical protein